MFSYRFSYLYSTAKSAPRAVKKEKYQTCVGVLNVKVSPAVDAASAKFLWLSKTWTARKFEGLRKRLARERAITLCHTCIPLISLRCIFPTSKVCSVITAPVWEKIIKELTVSEMLVYLRH